jgi:hypothetical protein
LRGQSGAKWRRQRSRNLCVLSIQIQAEIGGSVLFRFSREIKRNYRDLPLDRQGARLARRDLGAQRLGIPVPRIV